MSTTPITIDPGQIQAPPDFSSKAVVQLSSGQRVVGPRANLSAILKDDPGAKEIPVGADQIAVRLSNGQIAIGPKANILNLAQDDPGVRIVAGTLNGLPSRALTPEQQQQLEEMRAEPTGATGVATGFAKGAAETIKGTLNLAGKLAGKEGAGDEALVGFGGKPIDTQAKNTSQTIGKVGESILEFISGDEALKGLSLAERFAAAQKIAKLAETSPTLAKALDIGMTALRRGGVSGAQTLAKGGTPTQAVESAAIVSGVSGVFGAVGAGAGAIYRSIAAKSPEAVAAAKEAAEKEGSDLAQQIAGGRLGTAHEVAQNVGEKLADAADQMHSDYAQGLAQIGQKAQGIRVPLAGSALQKTAQNLLSDSTVPAEIQSAMKGVVPDSARLNPLLEELSTNPGSYSWEQMEATRQTIGQTIRKLPADSPLRPDLIRLRSALDDTMTKAATDSGNPEVAQAMTNLRSAYASKVQAFESNAIKTLASKNPDSVANALQSKQSVFNVNTLRSLIGADNMRPVEGSLLQRLVDNASTSGEFNPKSFATSFNRLGPDVQKAIWGDNLPTIKEFLNNAAKVPTVSPIWGSMARYLEHRAVFDVLASGAILGAGALGEELSGKRILVPAAIIAGIVALHNPRVLAQASNVLKLGAAAVAPAVAGAVAGQAAPEEQPAPAPQPIASGASIGEQLIAKAAQMQQQKAARLAAQQSRPDLPFHPGAGISR